jgi:hypothetical protein
MIEADAETLDARRQRDTHRRPVSRQEVMAMSETRRLAMLDLAPVAVVDTSRLTPGETVDEILRQAGPYLSVQRG